jgi:hypothetical protein
MNVYILIETSFDTDYDVHEDRQIVDVFFSEEDANNKKNSLEKAAAKENWHGEMKPKYSVEKHYAH